ncbi:MAG TPA: hypothetical protein VJ921_11865 [Vicinamibacteria bacterium]|nr:hypothetical protein [Vicinamibacteria bacterium]
MNVSEHVEKNRKLPRGPGGSDSQIRLGVRKMQDLRVVEMHRRARFSRVEPTSVHLTDVDDQIRLDPPRLLDDSGEITEQLVVGYGLK